jgi:MFS family permease
MPGRAARVLAPYRQLWGIPGAPVLMVGGFVARIGLGINILAWLLLVRETTGSYGTASLVSAVISVATAVVTPVAGRLLDRRGPGRVLPWFAAASTGFQLLLLVAVLYRLPLAVLLVLAALSGAVLPPMGAAVRAAWTTLTSRKTRHADARAAAMAADASLMELVYIVGPLLLAVTTLGGTALARPLGLDAGQLGPALAIALAALCTGFGTLAAARGRALSRLAVAELVAPRPRLGPLRIRRFPTLLVCAALLMFAFGAGPVAIAAFSHEHASGSSEAVTPVLYAIWGIGSALAGLAFGSLRPRWALHLQFVVLLVGVAIGFAVLAVMPDVVWLGIALFVTGVVVAPSLTVEATIAGQLTPAGMVNESFTWLAATNQCALALGIAVAGHLVDVGGAELGFAAGLVAAACAALFAIRLGAAPVAAPEASG